MRWDRSWKRKVPTSPNRQTNRPSLFLRNEPYEMIQADQYRRMGMTSISHAPFVTAAYSFPFLLLCQMNVWLLFYKEHTCKMKMKIIITTRDEISYSSKIKEKEGNERISRRNITWMYTVRCEKRSYHLTIQFYVDVYNDVSYCNFTIQNSNIKGRNDECCSKVAHLDIIISRIRTPKYQELRRKNKKNRREREIEQMSCYIKRASRLKREGERKRSQCIVNVMCDNEWRTRLQDRRGQQKKK